MTSSSEVYTERSLVVSYLALRKAVGIIGIALPLVLAIGNYILDGAGIESSISHYYHTAMRDVLVGSLCAIAVFLMSYRGYEWQDNIAGDLAGVFAIGAALFPTTTDYSATEVDKVIGVFHLGFAAAFFLTLAFFSLVLFRKTDKTKTPTPRKVLRNRVYSVCGYTILTCLAAIPIVSILMPEAAMKRLNPVFWLEAAAIWAFGWAWFTKGEGILKDEEV
jgi:hypothetical protein